MDFLKTLYFSNFSFQINPKEKLKLPEFASATIRGGFGYTFKKITCLQKEKKDCKGCIISSNCPYFILFEAKNLQKNLNKMEEIPKPFVIEIPLFSSKEYISGEKIKFNLTLFGDSLKFFPYFILSFIKLGNYGLGKFKIKYDIEKINQIYPLKKEIYKLNENSIREIEIRKNLKFKKKNIKILKINFLTPAKIKYKGEFVKELEFSILIESILRRAYLISKFWCEYDGKYKVKKIIESAKKIKIKYSNLKWIDLERFSTRQKRFLKYGGILGEIVYEGKLKEFYPILKLGSLIHIGKNTSFGFGKYMIQ